MRERGAPDARAVAHARRDDCGRAAGLPAALSTTYQIQIDSHGANTVITFAAAPTNDDFAAAKLLGPLPAKDSVVIRGASREGNETAPSGCGNGFSFEPSVWYTFTPAESQSLHVSASYGGVKSVFTTPGITVFTGAALNALAPVGGACSVQPNNAQADLTVPVTAGTPYRIRISQFRELVDPAIATTASFQVQ